MQKRKIALMAGTAILALAFFAVTAYAAGDGEYHPLPWGNFALRVANLVIYLGLFVVFGGKAISGFFKNRTKNIQENLSNLEKRRLQAEKDLEEMEKRISNLEEERQAILKDYRDQGEAIRASLIADAQAEAVAITEQAQKVTRHEMEQAIDKIREEVAELLVNAAEKLLPVKLSPEEQYQMVRKYLTKVVLN